MIKNFPSYFNDFAHLFFPHNCLGCGTDTLENNAPLCAACFVQLPETGFFQQKDNPVKNIFYGRVNIQNAASAFYFAKDSLLQHLIVELKYHGNKDAGYYLGKLLGCRLQESEGFQEVEIIVPVPLNTKKEKMRGYNQAAAIADGIAEVWHRPVIKNALGRKIFTETQTQKDRISRWQNMQDVFTVMDENLLKNKHILLVDDVVTTGATLEACGEAALGAENTKLSIATVAYTV